MKHAPLPLVVDSRCVGPPTSPIKATFFPELPGECVFAYGAPFATLVVQHAVVRLLDKCSGAQDRLTLSSHVVAADLAALHLIKQQRNRKLLLPYSTAQIQPEKLCLLDVLPAHVPLLRIWKLCSLCAI